MKSSRNALVDVDNKRKVRAEKKFQHKSNKNASCDTERSINYLKNKVISKLNSTDSCKQILEENFDNKKKRRKTQQNRKKSKDKIAHTKDYNKNESKLNDTKHSDKYKSSSEETNESTVNISSPFNFKRVSNMNESCETMFMKRETMNTLANSRSSDTFESAECTPKFMKGTEKSINISKETSKVPFDYDRNNKKINTKMNHLPPIDSQASSDSSNINISNCWRRCKDIKRSENSDNSNKNSTIISKPSIDNNIINTVSNSLSPSDSNSMRSYFSNLKSCNYELSDFSDEFEYTKKIRKDLQDKLNTRDKRNKLINNVSFKAGARLNPFRNSSPPKVNKASDVFNAGSKATKRKTKTNFNWIHLQTCKGDKVKHYRCFNEHDIEFPYDKLKNKIVKTQNDDDYDTDDEILERSVNKVIEDLNGAIIDFKDNGVKLQGHFRHF